jgi:hypothetical protein
MSKAISISDWSQVLDEVNGGYGEYLSLYSYNKYPAADYERFKKTFSALNADVEMRAALMWKWGHWGKDNFPAKQQALTAVAGQLWPRYCDWASSLDCERTAESTFKWWWGALEKKRYITCAYLTHLTHPEQVPIIDQHNFRAMNHLCRVQKAKRVPSNWSDIERLKSFVVQLAERLDVTESDLDKYLMMYGRSLKRAR